MKTNIIGLVITISAVFSQCGDVFSQSSQGGESSRVTILIMEDVLFQGITGTNEVDILNKKIARVEAAIVDPNEKNEDPNLEQRRLQLYASLKNRLIFEKNKLTSK